METVSLRFADLIAQEAQSNLLDVVSRQTSSAQNEEELASSLFQALTLRCGQQPMFYLGLGEKAAYVRFIASGGPQPQLPAPIRCPSVLERCEHPLLSYESLTAAFGDEFPARYGLLLRYAHTPLALVAFESIPADPLLFAYLTRLAAHSSLALMALRQQDSLRNLKQVFDRQHLHLRRQNRTLQMLDPGSRLAPRLESWQQQLEALLSLAVSKLDGEKGSLMVLDDASQELVVRHTCGLERDLQERIRNGEHACKRFRLGEGLAGTVAQNLQPQIVNAVEREPLFLEPLSSQVHSIMCLPLEVDGQALGVLNITNKAPGRKFLPKQIEEGLELAMKTARLVFQARPDRLAIGDPLTGSYSKNYLYLRTHEEVARARRYQSNLCFLVIHLQGLNALRSRFGDLRAAEVERDFSGVLQQAVRETDLVGRWGDESFAVLMPETKALEGMFAAERICQDASDCDLLQQNGVSAHVGLNSYPEQSASFTALLSKAERAAELAVRSLDCFPVTVWDRQLEGNPVNQQACVAASS